MEVISLFGMVLIAGYVTGWFGAWMLNRVTRVP